MKYSQFYISALTLLASHALQAHVSVDTANGPAIAGKSYLVTLNLPHGCSGSDTYKIEVEMPSGFKLSRPVDSDFGVATITKETLAVPFVMHGKTYEDDVTKITWEKPESEIKASDTHLYRVSFRSTLPDTPFATAYLKTTQTCKMPDGSTEKLEWVGTGGHDDHSATLSRHRRCLSTGQNARLEPLRYPSMYMTSAFSTMQRSFGQATKPTALTPTPAR